MDFKYKVGTKICALSLLMGLMLMVLAGCGSGDAETVPLSSSGTSATLAFSTSGATGGAVQGSTPPQAVEIDTAESMVNINDFLISVEEIELERDGEVEIEIEFEGSFIVDILNSSITDLTTGVTGPELLTSLTPGIYHEVEFELIPSGQLVPGDTEPWSVFVTGSYPSPTDNASRSFVIKLNPDPIIDEEKIEVENPAGIEIAGNDNDLLLAFQLDGIFTPALLDSLLKLDESSGVFMLPSPSLEASQFLALLEEHLDFEEHHHGEDHHGDHHHGDVGGRRVGLGHGVLGTIGLSMDTLQRHACLIHKESLR